MRLVALSAFLIFSSLTFASMDGAKESKWPDSEKQSEMELKIRNDDIEMIDEKIRTIEDFSRIVEEEYNTKLSLLDEDGKKITNSISGLKLEVNKYLDGLTNADVGKYFNGNSSTLEDSLDNIFLYRISPKYVVLSDLERAISRSSSRFDSISTLVSNYERKSKENIPKSWDKLVIEIESIDNKIYELSITDSNFEGGKKFRDLHDDMVNSMSVFILNEEKKIIEELKDFYEKKKNSIKDVFRNRTIELDNERSELLKEAVELEKHLRKIKGKQITTFESIFHMMVLLAFIFAITVFAKVIRPNSKIISDPTLVEYAGMSFLLLAVIILATGGSIEAQTVGPLLGTIAGYIFGKSVGKVRDENTNVPVEPEKSKKEGDEKLTPSSVKPRTRSKSLAR